MSKRGNISIFVPHIGCPHMCSFCDQRTISGAKSAPTAECTENVCKEASEHLKKCNMTGEIAFFGGSFTAIPREYMLSLLKAAEKYVDGEYITGIRLSTRPDAIDEEILDILAQNKVSAIELGVQSMDDNVLTLNRRGHTVQDVYNAVHLIRSHPHKFELGLQMMPGLYGDTPDGAIETAKKIAALKPDTSRIYPTLVIEGTHLAQLYHEGKYKPLSLDTAVEICSEILEMFTKCGINVIRVGLHDSEELKDSLVAGPYHPAMREKCESYIMFKNISSCLKEHEKGEVEIIISPKDRSKFAGQKKENLIKWKNEGFTFKIHESADIEPLGFKII